jgi:class 3 adenylate cyclase
MGKIYLPVDLKNRLDKEGIQLDRVGGQKKIIVMFVDLRGFSKILEKREPKRVLKILDIYFRMITSIVKKHDGIVDKYIGDGLMAVWGLPVKKNADIYWAIRAAIEIRIGMFRLIPELVHIGEGPLEIGIGIGTGNAVAGFIGPSSRRDFTLVGKCINRAARLQSIASDNRIFIDEGTAQEIKPYSYIIAIPQTNHKNILPDERIYELEGIYEFAKDYESTRRYPRVIIAKVVGITKLPSGQRKAALIKSISEGGLGIEVHDYKDFILKIGDKAMFDSKKLGLLKEEDTTGLIIRKMELKGSGIFHIKTWDIGVKILNLSEEVKKKLLKVSTQGKVLSSLF